MRALRVAGTALALGCIALSAQAGFVSATQPSSGVGAATIAKGAFVGSLSNVGYEHFSGFNEFDPGGNGFDPNTGDPVPLNVSFPPRTTTGQMMINLDPSLTTFSMQVLTDASAGSGELGRYDTTDMLNGSPPAAADRKYLEWLGSVTLTFSAAVHAFGLYVTDMNDFAVGTTMCMNPDPNDPTATQQCETLTAGGDGSLTFWGFSDASHTYTSVTFTQTLVSSTALDGVGFDDMFIGDIGTTQVPEPASLALGGLALLSLAALRRRRTLH